MKLTKKLIYLFFSIAILEIVAGIFLIKELVFVCKPLMSLVLVVLYFKAEIKEQKTMLYYISSFFAALYHIFLIFKDGEEMMLAFGMNTFAIYYLVNIIIAKNMLSKVQMVPAFIAITPFILISTYELYELKSFFKGVFVSVIITGSILAIFFGFALYSYLVNANKKTVLLLTSAIFISLSTFAFALDNFYIELPIFKMSLIIGNTVALYTFYKFMITENTEKITIDFQ